MLTGSRLGGLSSQSVRSCTCYIVTESLIQILACYNVQSRMRSGIIINFGYECSHSIKILDVLNQIAFPIERSIRALERTMRHTTFTLSQDKLLLWNSAQDTMHLPVHAVYSAVQLWWRTTLGTTADSAPADEGGKWPCQGIHSYLSHICRTAVGMLGLAVA